MILPEDEGGWFQSLFVRKPNFSYGGLLFFSRKKYETNQGFKNEIMSGHDELVLIPEEEIDTSDISENESDDQNTKTINDQSVEMVGLFIFEILRSFPWQMVLDHQV